MADLKNAVENVLDRMRGRRPASEPAPTGTAEPAMPSEKVPSARNATSPLDNKAEGRRDRSLALRDRHDRDQELRIGGTDASQTDERGDQIQAGAALDDFEVGDYVVYSNHGAGVVLQKETEDLLGEKRAYLTIQFLHSSMTALVPCENAHAAGLRRAVDGEEAEKVIGVLTDEVSEIPNRWTRRLKANREKIKTGDVYELAEVVRNLASRECQQGLSGGEKEMYNRAKRNLASELMYALGEGEDAESYLDRILEQRFETGSGGSVRTSAPVLALTSDGETDGSASQAE
jgi:CarD family transcriptional regulator, regulator of rRNA transcription